MALSIYGSVVLRLYPPEHFFPGSLLHGVHKRYRQRVEHHNSGGSFHASKYRPWELKTYLAFADEDQALEFERYLKTSSGRAFAKKRF